MQFFLLVLHIALAVLNAALSIINFKWGEPVLGTLLAITSALWVVLVVTDIESLLC